MLKKFFFITILLFTLLPIITPFVLAAKDIKFKPQIGVGEEFPAGKEKVVTGTTFGEYIAAFYKYFIGAIAILAVVMIMWGGFLWLTAAGSSSQIGVAKTRISGALIGLILALSSYLLLNTINPKLVKFEPLVITPIETITQELKMGEAFETQSKREEENLDPGKKCTKDEDCQWTSNGEPIYDWKCLTGAFVDSNHPDYQKCVLATSFWAFYSEKNNIDPPVTCAKYYLDICEIKNAIPGICCDKRFTCQRLGGPLAAERCYKIKTSQ